MNTDWLFGIAIVCMVVVALVATALWQASCERKGGMLVRSMLGGYECIRGEVIR